MSSLLLAALLAASAAAEEPDAVEPIAVEPIEEEAPAPCGPAAEEPPAQEPADGQAGRAPRRRTRARTPCPRADAPAGTAPYQRPAVPMPEPAVDERRAEEQRLRRRTAGQTAQRDAQTLLSSLTQGAPDGAVSGGPPGAALPAAAPPGGALPPAAQSRYSNTLQTVAPPTTAPAKPAAPEVPWYKRAWQGSKDFVDRWTPSPLKLADDVYFEASRRFPDSSGHNTEQDAWRHARWHQRMVDSMCPETGRSVCAPVAAAVAWTAGAVHEAMGAVSGQPASELKMDMSNNWTGLKAGLQGGDPKLIDEALSSGRLVILEPTPAFKPLARR